MTEHHDGLLGRIANRYRRPIPFSIAALALAACLSPLYTDWISTRAANLWTLLIASIVFAYMAIQFFSLRRRIAGDPRQITRFGETLVDFFTAHAVFACFWCVVYGVIFTYAWGGQNLPSRTMTTPVDVQTINRATIISGGTLIVMTGIALSRQMEKSGPSFDVHEPTGNPWRDTVLGARDDEGAPR